MKGVDSSFCGDLLAQVGEELLHEFTRGSQSRDTKGLVGRFNEANDHASKKIKTSLTQKFPEIHWLDAEFDKSQYNFTSKGCYWVCDPIDGALNFLQGIPFWSLSLCLIQNGQPVMSIVYDPCRKEQFHAHSGLGTFLNGNRITVSDTTDICDSILATAHPTFVREYMEDTKYTARDIYDVLPKVRAVRMLGTVSLQLAYVANGRIDGYWEHGFDMYDWWSGALLVKEAGGVVTDMSSGGFKWGTTGIIATNLALNSKLKKELTVVG